MSEQKNIDLAKINAARVGHNFFMQERAGEYHLEDLNVLNSYVNYVLAGDKADLPSYKVGIMFVCINPPYWQYCKPIIEDVQKYFLPGHEVEIMLFSDLPEAGSEAEKNLVDSCLPQEELVKQPFDQMRVSKEYVTATIADLRSLKGVTIMPVESAPWPYPTLMRYHLFLGQEEYLKKFDYLFYLDLDMRIVNIVGDEILAEGLMAAQHPMYAVRKEYVPPYEPNPASAAYIPRPGRIIEQGGKPRFEPLYFAGGFQGGKAALFIKAMQSLKKMINTDMNQNYVAIWNDESYWNRYLFDNPPTTVLSPSYVYPDSLVNEYYSKIWGRTYIPRILTITKKFTTNQEGGAAVEQMIKTL